MKTRIRDTFNGLLLLAIATGCGGGSGSGGGSGGGAITDASRDAAIKGIESKFAELLGRHMPRDQVNQAMADYISTQPLFEEAGVSRDECAWGRFKDGRILVVVNNRD